MSRFASLLGGRRGTVAVGVIGLAIGGSVGAAVAHEVAPPVVMAPVSVTRIGALDGIAAPWFGETVASVRGRVVEVFGDRFVLDDGSGRALIELGHAPSGLVSTGQTVTVQGRPVQGGLRAQFVVTADGQVVALRGPRGPRGEGRRDHGPGHGPDHGPAFGGEARPMAAPDGAPPAPAPTAPPVN